MFCGKRSRELRKTVVISCWPCHGHLVVSWTSSLIFCCYNRMHETRSCMNNTSLFLTILDAGKSEDSVPASGEEGLLAASLRNGGTMCPEAQLRGRSAAEVFLLLGVSSCDVFPQLPPSDPTPVVWSQRFTVLALRAMGGHFSLFLGSITGPSQSVSSSQPTVTSGSYGKKL